MTTRSSRLAVAILPANQTTVIYTAPPGAIILLKTVLLQRRTGTEGTAYCSVLSASPAGSVDLFAHVFTAESTYFWEGWIVLNAGDGIRLLGSQCDLGVWVSGTELV